MSVTSRPTQQTADIRSYTRLWNGLKYFPIALARGADTAPDTSGPAAAAILSATFSCFALMVNQHITMVSKSWDSLIWALGAWMPGSHNPDPLYGQLGSYSGKVTVLLLSWLISWPILHLWLRHRQIRPRTIFIWMLVFLIAATAMNWHPLFPYAPLT